MTDEELLSQILMFGWAGEDPSEQVIDWVGKESARQHQGLRLEHGQHGQGRPGGFAFAKNRPSRGVSAFRFSSRRTRKAAGSVTSRV